MAEIIWRILDCNIFEQFNNCLMLSKSHFTSTAVIESLAFQKNLIAGLCDELKYMLSFASPGNLLIQKLSTLKMKKIPFLSKTDNYFDFM